MQISLSVVGLGFDAVKDVLCVYCVYGQWWYIKCSDKLRVRLGADLGLGADVFGLEFQTENPGIFPCLPESFAPHHRKTLIRIVGMLRRCHERWVNIRWGLFLEEASDEGELSSDRQGAANLASEAGCTDKRERLTARSDGFGQGAIDEIKRVLLATKRARS